MELELKEKEQHHVMAVDCGDRAGNDDRIALADEVLCMSLALMHQ